MSEIRRLQRRVEALERKLEVPATQRQRLQAIRETLPTATTVAEVTGYLAELIATQLDPRAGLVRRFTESFDKADGANWGPDLSWSAGGTTAGNRGTRDNGAGALDLTPRVFASTSSVYAEWEIDEFNVEANDIVASQIFFYGSRSGTGNAYWGGWIRTTTSDEMIVGRVGGVGGTGNLDTEDPSGLVAGDRVRVEMEDQGSGSYAIRCYLNSTLKATFTTAAGDMAFAGPIKCFFRLTRRNFAGSEATIYIDNFQFGDL